MKLTPFLLTVAALTLTTHAATITWGPATNINPAGGAASDLDVDITGTLVRAFNLGSTGVPGTTVHGVNFEAFGVPPGTPSVTIGNFTLAAGGGGLSAFSPSSLNPPFGTLSASYQDLLGRTAFPSGTFNPMTLTMNGLTVGQTYEFQWWSNLSLAAAGGSTASAGNSVTLLNNTTNTSGGLGQYAIGTFLANSPSQVITFNGTAQNSGQSNLNGFQLRQLAPAVPEPGTALFGVALCAVAGLRRRR